MGTYLKLEIKEINDVRMLLDGIYCLITHSPEYPQYGFPEIKRMTEMAIEIESQTNKELSNVERALHLTPSPDEKPKTSDNYKGFGDK